MLALVRIIKVRAVVFKLTYSQKVCEHFTAFMSSFLSFTTLMAYGHSARLILRHDVTGRVLFVFMCLLSFSLYLVEADDSLF